ncbi:DUF6234 family protein [Streptomyces sp. NPDC051920]|uniref:DUF6234 family protein n=1 Tax=Streptomyces sp. NPDC051920 TaxID=3155523 RepID=UPI003443EDC0
MPSDPASRTPRGLEGLPDAKPSLDTRGDAFAGGCLILVLLLLEIPIAVLLMLAAGFGGWDRSSGSGKSGTSSMNWEPVIWFGVVTLAVLLAALALLRWAHPLAWSTQMLVATASLIITITVWHAEYDRAHHSPVPSCPTRAGMLCEPEGSTPAH